MARDTILYMFAKIIEGLIGVITVAAYTYCFIPEEYGKYNIVNLTIVTSAMIVMNWLSQAVMRYVNEYDMNSEKDKFYSTTFFVWLKINIFLVIIASTCILIYTQIFDKSIASILWLSLTMFITYGTNLLVINILVVKRKIKLNLLLSLSSIIIKLAITLLLIKLFGARIEWILIPNIIFDALFVLIATIKLDIIKYISYSKYSKEVLKKFTVYGIPIIGLTFSTSILYNSDRYIINVLINSAAVGIYYANYSLMSAAFSMFSNAVMKGSYPSILKAWNDGDKQATLGIISQAVRHYLLFAVPAIVGVCVLAESVSKLLLEPAYVEGYVVMKWVAIGMTFLGLTEYSNKYWELEVNTKVIFKHSLISGIINIALNIILVPLYGYKIAAVTTAFGFLVYFILSFMGSRKQFKWILTANNYIRIISSAVIMGIILKLLLNFVSLSFINITILVVVGIMIYGLCLYITGEIREEVIIIKNFIIRRKD